jgi:protein tyrosine phosphatase (PTP) superfamily phosphohydrolase (DUF442 family)
MASFELPSDIVFNTGRIEDPSLLVREHQAASWLLLTGEEFAAQGGLSFAQVQQATGQALNVPSDQPRVLDLDLARKHVAALDALPRPTLVTCRMGPRSSAAAYMYAGLRAGADPEDVIAEAKRKGAPFTKSEEYVAWVKSSIEALRR